MINFYSNSLINSKKSKIIYLANNKISKGLKESKEQIEEIKKEINALKYFDNNNETNKYKGFKSKKNQKQQYQNRFNNNNVYKSNAKKLRNIQKLIIIIFIMIMSSPIIMKT